MPETREQKALRVLKALHDQIAEFGLDPRAVDGELLNRVGELLEDLAAPARFNKAATGEAW